MTVDNKIVLITGANRGIGHSIMSAFINAGYIVVGTSRSDDGVKKINDTIGDPSKGCGVKMDVTSENDIQSANKLIRDKFGITTILINNAGVTKDNLLMRMSSEEWNDVIDTNLNSLYRVTKEFIREMMKQKTGRIINISSVVGMSGNAGQSNYSSSKSAIYGFTKSLAKEVASRNITVNAISPGFIETDMTDKLSDEQKQAIISAIPLSRMGSAKDIADITLFLASDSASYITGENINVNGGLYM
ncbi:MAG: beta-ketoacyl-ACP reductase [Gammaproteobacteria bacterium]|jgi:3-oxoacyl-[acyl-carrier protein] reductase|nr:MAG: beta-ketoacyl-ACP reductase [Gammaproteobacteria bacterium]|tara:strand:- start:5807 stop:6544 length:738 start_codon:yes stop_codon:yes gene_type:complete